MCILSSLCRRNCGTPLPFRRRRRDACDGLTFRLLTTSCRSSCCVSRFLAASKSLAACTNCCLHKYDRSPSRATRATGVLFVRCGETLVRLVRPAPARVVVALPCTSNKQQAPQASPFCCVLYRNDRRFWTAASASTGERTRCPWPPDAETSSSSPRGLSS